MNELSPFHLAISVNNFESCKIFIKKSSVVRKEEAVIIGQILIFSDTS